MESIVASAIIHNGKIYVGPRHHDCIRIIKASTGERTPGSDPQGFVTESGKFLNRIEAGEYAIKIGQIKKLNWPPRLYSEDLW